jgi:LysR family transcriptional regulator (chromosome initiation inhibitor)
VLDYAALRALAAVAQAGSFEKAASLLNVTPSAVSQRIKNLEERMGIVLVIRGNPCVATEKGEWLCRHLENIGMLERDLLEQLPSLASADDLTERVTVHVATNADSLGTWFMEALSKFAHNSMYLVHVAVDDEDHTADWLQRGRVSAAVTGFEKTVPGCRRVSLGSMRYHATASPEFVARHFSSGINAESLRNAPALTFNQKDTLQTRWIVQTLGADIACPTHWLPSTHAFVEASLSGMGWGMNPSRLVHQHLRTGKLVELIPDTPLDIPLFWQINRLAADRLSGLTNEVSAVARRHLAA